MSVPSVIHDPSDDAEIPLLLDGVRARRAAEGMRQVTVRAHLFKARRAIRTRMLQRYERMMKEYRS